ncbi:MAG: DNA/RNA helicase domain-containing protein [Candidatus Thiodiazotropha sp.]
MIVYSATKSEFNSDVITNAIADKILNKFQEKLGRTTTKQEIDSWKNSMMYMNNILSDNDIPSNAGVSIEYKIPQTSNRIDFILTGKDRHKTDTVIIVELKQWTDVKRTGKDAIVETCLGKGRHEVNHPSYQAWTYAALLQDFNETVREEDIALKPCAYLHNCEAYDVINHSCYHEHTAKAPSFLKNDTRRLRSFIKQHVKYGDANNIMYRIDHGKIKPSKNLADTLVSLMKGNPEFIMIDDQKLVFETVLALAEQSTTDNKHVLIIEGGPGTGKSVVAINLLVELTRVEKLVQYVTKNAAPREVYRSKLTGSFKKSHIDNLFKGSGSYHRVEPNALDVLVVDEAHRLVERGTYDPVGGNQIKEIINAAKHSVFFIDEDQRVTWKDIGEKQEIRKWTRLAGATVHELELASQFRCNGSDGYLAWVDNGLQIRQTANETLEGIDYDFRVFDSPNELRDTIFEKNRENNKARLVAGYCWDWVSQKDPSQNDIVFKEYNFSMKWNLKTDGSLWIMKPETIKEIGCIHTCQGLELDYIGVIVGPDLIVRNGLIISDAAQRSKMDSSVKGYKKLLQENSETAKARADTIIKNTYRTLMTRGQKGCYLYCTDPETNAYFKALVSEKQKEEQTAAEQQNLPFRRLSPEEVKPYENAVPMYNLEVAAGEFSNPQQVDECEWVELPDSFRPQQGHFVARVIGESMNKRIPNGAWCLFKGNPGGSRNNKVVLVQHRDIQDQDTGATYTVKLYNSEKHTAGDEWQHSKIVLKPDSSINGYRNLEFDAELEGELYVIGEFVAVIG